MPPSAGDDALVLRLEDIGEGTAEIVDPAAFRLAGPYRK